MTDKELRRLSRSELIDIIYELQKQNQQKDAAYQELQNELEKKTLILSEAGSIAEAALQINDVFKAAQAAADQYVLSVEAMSGEAEKTIAEARLERDRIIREAQEKAKKIEESARNGAALVWNDFQAQVSKTIQQQKELSLSSGEETQE
mgnify:FL=1